MTRRKTQRAGIYGTTSFANSDVSATNLSNQTGILIKVIVSAKDTGNVKLYDSTVSGANNANNQIANIDTANTETSYDFNASFTNGLNWEKSGNSSVTVVYR